MSSEERTNLEVIAPTVEDAVSKGLSDLGLPEDAVDIEVLDAGSRGIFGIGSRQARVRLTIKNKPAPTPVSSPAKDLPAPKAPVSVDKKVEPVAVRSEPKPAPAGSEPSPAAIKEEDRDLRVARETVSELLDKMKVRASVTAKYAEGTEPKEVAPILVEIHGNDLSILIGRKSEILDALQYITSLIVGKELDRWAPIQIDVEGYRVRRERVLRQLAHRLADQVVSTGRKQVLEPMPANERRVVHMELRDHQMVTTESTGEEPNRKVTILLKK
jgi:spoIIIJ-associated protein